MITNPEQRRFLGIVAVFIALLLADADTAKSQDDPRMIRVRGQTMGTTYMVKVFDPPAFDQPLQLLIDSELRKANDEMSTYLKSSEISRFNASDSTDWVSVSRSFAEVVKFSLDLSRKTDGAFDVTVGPLVNAWNFGPEEQETRIPDEETLQQRSAWVGYERLSVRLDPPAIRKAIPELQIDLSSIAKGHGVDRVVELLDRSGATNVFVEIGGEVRTSGDKAGQWWKVGIQVPDAVRDMVMIGHSMSSDAGTDEAMATSGDYRNFFASGGVRYSHTIDPRTARPITHDLASVSVIAETCMAADAWATAINVLGPEEGLDTARRENLDVLLVRRGEDRYLIEGTGVLAQYATPEVAITDAAPTQSIVPTLILASCVFGVLLFAMSIGVIFGRRSISGSCGGLANSRDEDGNVSCSLCSNPDNACKELRQRMEAGQTVSQDEA